MKKSDIPNLLSTLRLAMVPIFVYLFLTHHVVLAVIVFVAAGATDILDGYIARKYNYISDLGKILDPLADKLMQFSAFLCLFSEGLIPIWMPAIYFVKEALTALGAVCVFKKSKAVVKSNIFGKAATVLVFAAVCVITVFGHEMPQNITNIICIVVCVYFLFSCLMYALQEFINYTKSKGTDANKTGAR